MLSRLTRFLPLWLVAGFVLALALVAAAQEPPDAGLVIEEAIVRTAPAVPPSGDPLLDALAAVERMGDAGTSWSVRVGLLLIAAVALLRKYATKLPGVAGAFFASSDGGSTLLFLLTFGGTFGAALSAGRPLSGGLAWSALLLAVTTAGGWHVALKPLWQRAIRPLLARLLPGLFPAPVL